MQWTDGPNAGFSSGHPWLPVPASYKTHNVATEVADPDSVLQFYRQLLKLRHTDRALLDGGYVALNPDDTHVLSYLRRYKDETLVVVLNMSGERQQVRLDLSPLKLRGRAQTVLTTMRRAPHEMALDELDLEPFAVYLGRINGF
jgi:alpha-glucosidase